MKSLVVLAVLAQAAAADNVTVGVFAPSAPFPSTAARVELATRLGDHIGKALGGTGNGRVYARAGDFAAAVKKGEITVALVDAAYLASGGGGAYTVIASSVRANDGWQLVARGGGKKVADLKGKTVLVPSNGGRETDFVVNVLFGGVPRDFFAKVEPAADTASALGALGLGKADAAIVPAGVELPGGTQVVRALPAVAGPTLVAYGTLSATQRSTLASAAGTFKGDTTITGFRAGDADGIRAIQRRFTAAPKRGPVAVPGYRLVVGDLVEGRNFPIERTPVATYAVSPKP